MSKREKRKHDRIELSCPLTFSDGSQPINTQSENLSDGGAFITVSTDSLPSLGRELDVSLSIPRSTKNTFLLEEVKIQARVLRHQPMLDPSKAGLAMQFTQSLELML